MSEWLEAKYEDMEIDGDEINIRIGINSMGTVYATVKIEDIKKVLNNRVIAQWLIHN